MTIFVIDKDSEDGQVAEMLGADVVAVECSCSASSEAVKMAEVARRSGKEVWIGSRMNGREA